MNAFHVTWQDNNAVEYFHGTTLAQARMAARSTRAAPFTIRPATAEEHAALMRAHSAVLDAGDE